MDSHFKHFKDTNMWFYSYAALGNSLNTNAIKRTVSVNIGSIYFIHISYNPQ